MGSHIHVTTDKLQISAIIVWLAGTKSAPTIGPPVTDIPKMTVKKLPDQG